MSIINVSTHVQDGAGRLTSTADTQRGSGNAQAKHREDLNKSILAASVAVSIEAKNEPLRLLFKTALDEINNALESEMGKNAIQDSVDQDNTPEGTAQRIVTLSSAFFDAFKQQHPGEEEAAVLERFMETISKGIDQGFSEARGILDGLGVLNGEIATNIDRTYELVQDGLIKFGESLSNRD